MAAKLSNPTAAVASLNNNFDYRTYDGDLPDSNDQDSFTWGFQPTIPYPLEHGNVIFRPLFPILVKQPVFDVGSGEFDDEDWNLGNVSYDLVYGTTEPNGFMWFLGMVGAFPTASDDDLGADAWSAGPEAFAGIKKDWGLVGVLAGQQWDYAGDDDVSLTTGQYFYALKLPQLGPGWQLASGPTWSYDHEADSDDALTLPVGIGLAKTTKLGGRFWKFQLQYWNYVESPDTYGPDWQIRFSIAPVLAVPWGK